MAVSVLIPGFRPTYLRQALGSVLAQDADDLEIIVSDDSGSDALAPVLDRFKDPRLRHVRTSGRIGAQANCAALWREARHDLVKYVFDDDVLMPHALPTLIDAARRHPDASFWFGTRHVIDGQGRIRTEARPLQKPELVIGAAGMVRSMLPGIGNPLGEFTNVLVNRRVAAAPDLFLGYAGFDIRVLGDVAFFLQATRLGHAVGVNCCVASFRRHGDQNSSPDANPSFAIGLAEWELFVRGERVRGTLGAEDTRTAAARLREIYRSWLPRLPALHLLLDGLDHLERDAADPAADLLGEVFRQSWQSFIEAVGAASTAGSAG